MEVEDGEIFTMNICDSDNDELPWPVADKTDTMEDFIANYASESESGTDDAPAAASTTDSCSEDCMTLKDISPDLSKQLTSFVQNTKEVPTRRVWMKEEKELVLKILQEKKMSVQGTHKFLQRQFSGTILSKVTRAMVRRWASTFRSNGDKFKPRGPKRDEDFEAEVLSDCIVLEHSPPEDGSAGPSLLTTVANDMHSYAMVQHAAREVQKQEKWQGVKSVQQLKFGCTWVQSFLARYGMRRKRVTADRKGTRPSDAEIRETMARMQAIITENKISPKFTLNTDETGVFYGQGPRNHYVPIGNTKGGIRGNAAHSTMKTRFTASITGSAEGDLLPEYLIIACSVAKPDLSRVRVIANLHEKPGFTQEEGWELKWWEQTLPIKNKKTENEYDYIKFVRPYLIHGERGTVITCQKKAWMDTPAICMWVELVLKPWLDANQCPDWGALLTWDHCGPHKTRAVHEMLERYKIWAECLPKNMTDWLQVMDLVVNGPYKSNTRRLRLQDLHAYMQAFQVAYYRAKAKGEDAPHWNPPKPALTRGLLNSMKALHGMDADAEFRHGMRKSFEQVGLRPKTGCVVENPEALWFAPWTGAEVGSTLSARACGKLVKMLCKQEAKQVALADIVDDSNLILLDDDEDRDEDVHGHEEDDEECDDEIE